MLKVRGWSLSHSSQHEKLQDTSFRFVTATQDLWLEEVCLSGQGTEH